MNNSRLLKDFLRKHKRYIVYFLLSWFLLTVILAYQILMRSTDMYTLICLGYIKAKLRDLCIFLPDNLFNHIDAVVVQGDFRRVLQKYQDDFSLENWRLYLRICGVFFVSFSAIFIAAYTFFKVQLKKFHSNIKITGRLLNLEEFQHKHPAVFGNYFKLANIPLAEQVFERPICIFGKKEELFEFVQGILTEARESKRKIVIAEEKGDLCSDFAVDSDLILNPFKENGLSWNFLEDLRCDKPRVVSELMNAINIKEQALKIEDLILNLANLDISTSAFFKILCFSPISQIKETLAYFINLEGDADFISNLRKEIADKIYQFKALISDKNEISLHEYNNSETSILWIPGENNAHMKSLIPFMNKLINPEIIRVVCGHNLVSATKNTIFINPTMPFKNANMIMLSYDERTAKLFGETEIQYPSFCGIHYPNEHAPIVGESSGSFLKFSEYRDILKVLR